MENNTEDKPEKKKFKVGCLGIIAFVVIAFFIGLFIGISSNTTTTTYNTSTASVTNANTDTNANTTVSSVSTTPITLTSGNYTAGKDFPAGTYTIEAISGYGDVSSSNMYSGGLNEVMAPSGSGNSDTISNYKNVELPSGTTLTISDVTIKLIPVN